MHAVLLGWRKRVWVVEVGGEEGRDVWPGFAGDGGVGVRGVLGEGLLGAGWWRGGGLGVEGAGVEGLGESWEGSWWGDGEVVGACWMVVSFALCVLRRR